MWNIYFTMAIINIILIAINIGNVIVTYRIDWKWLKICSLFVCLFFHIFCLLLQFILADRQFYRVENENSCYYICIKSHRLLRSRCMYFIRTYKKVTFLSLVAILQTIKKKHIVPCIGWYMNYSCPNIRFLHGECVPESLCK